MNRNELKKRNVLICSIYKKGRNNLMQVGRMFNMTGENVSYILKQNDIPIVHRDTERTIRKHMKRAVKMAQALGRIPTNKQFKKIFRINNTGLYTGVQQISIPSQGGALYACKQGDVQCNQHAHVKKIEKKKEVRFELKRNIAV